MKRAVALALAALLCAGCFACGKDKPEPGPTTASVFNNGGRYVNYGGSVYYWEYWPACIEQTAIWGEFPEVPGIRRSMMRLNADGTQENLFTENGCGEIWICRDRFYLTWLDDDYTQQIFTTAMERGNAMGDAIDRREIGSGEIFSLDEIRGLLIVTQPRDGGVCTYDTNVQMKNILPVTHAELLLYDAPSATLYYRDYSIGEPGTVKLCSINVMTKEVSDIARIEPWAYEESFEDANAIEFDNTWLEGDLLHVFMSGYSGNAYMYMGSTHLTIDMAGGSIGKYDAGDAPDYSRYAADKPFDMRDIQGYDEYYGYYIRDDKDELRHILSYEDTAELGLPDGPYYTEEAFADVRNVEYVDGAIFFSIIFGPRNAAEDIGWREAYDFENMHVYRKDLATGKIEELYSFDKNAMRGGSAEAAAGAEPIELRPAVKDFMRFDDDIGFVYSSREDTYGFEGNHAPGCSVWCAVEDSQETWTATSTLRASANNSYEAKNLGDGSRETVWCAGFGVGDAAECAVTIDLLEQENPLEYTGLCIVNGYAKTEALWRNNARVKTLVLSVDGEQYARISLEDTIKPQFFDLGMKQRAAKPPVSVSRLRKSTPAQRSTTSA